MREKTWYYWIEGDAGEKLYFAEREDFLEHLRENDPSLSGADLLSDIEYEKLSQESGDL